MSLWQLTGPVDFDCDGVVSTAAVRAEVGGNASITPLPGFDDWPHVAFRGEAIGLLGAPAGPAATAVDEPPVSQLISYQQVIDQALAAIRSPAVPAPAPPTAPIVAPVVTPSPPLVLSHLRIRPRRFLAAFRVAGRGPAAKAAGRSTG